MNVRLFAVLAFVLAPLFSDAAVLGNIGYDTTFQANGSLAAIQNLGNGTFSNGEQVIGVSIRIAAPLGSIFRPEIRSFLATSDMSTVVEAAYQPSAGGENVFHFDLPTPFVPAPSECYILMFYQFSSAPNTTFYGWSTDQYTASTTGCHPQYASHNINIDLQNPALNGHGMVDYSFQIHTESIQSPPGISNLRQFRQFGVDEIAEGATFVGNAAVFKADIADADSEQVKLEVELKPIDVAFDGGKTRLSDLATPGIVELAYDELIPIAQHYVSGGNIESFHWRARAVDAEGNAGEWVEYTPSGASADFTAKVVPLYTQITSSFPFREDEDEWAGQLYASGVDNDCSRNDPLNANIARCGCAISSLVMVAKYHGLTNGVDNLPINPLNINAWLKANNGYIGDNLVSWSKAEEYLGIKIGNEPHAVLAFDRANYKTTSSAVVNSFLQQENPVIAFNSTAGHYFVMDNTINKASGSTYTVRDPRWYRTQTLSDAQNLANEVKGYNNVFTHATIFTKLPAPTKIAAHTELYLASPAELLVMDAQGRRSGKDPVTNAVYNEIPGALYSLEDTISSSDVDLDPSTAHQTKVLSLPVLLDGTYTVKVIGTGTGSYTLTSAMTNGVGSTAIETFTASTTQGAVTQYDLVVTGGEPQDTSPTPPPPPSIPELFTSLKNTIKSSNAKTLVKAALLIQVAAAEKTYQKNKITETNILLTALEKEITLLKKKKQISITDADKILAAIAALKARL